LHTQLKTFCVGIFTKIGDCEEGLPYIQVWLTGQEGTNIAAIYDAHLKREPICKIYKHTYGI
jgi:hypothetical protein